MRSSRWTQRARKCWETSGRCYEETGGREEPLGEVLRVAETVGMPLDAKGAEMGASYIAR